MFLTSLEHIFCDPKKAKYRFVMFCSYVRLIKILLLFVLLAFLKNGPVVSKKNSMEMKRVPLFFYFAQLFPTPHLTPPKPSLSTQVRLGADAREVLSPTSDSDKQIWKAFCASATRSSTAFVISSVRGVHAVVGLWVPLAMFVYRVLLLGGLFFW